MKISTLLVPTDFSGHAGLALDAVCGLAPRLGAAVHLVHGIHLPPEAAPYLFPDAIERIREQAGAELRARCERLESSGIRCTAELVDGPPAPAIARVAQELPADLIVMGSHGRTGLAHAVLGSVAERTLRTAPCPVLTLKAPLPAAGRLERIVVAMDFSAGAHAALRLARALARDCGPAHLILVHAHAVPPEIAELFAEQGTPLPPLDLRPVSHQLAQLLVELQESGCSAEFVTEVGHPDSALAEVAGRLDADLIVMGTHGRRGTSRLLLGSVAETVVRAARCGVLTVRPQTEATTGQGRKDRGRETLAR